MDIKCKKCGTINVIKPPERKLKKAVRIELSCLNCGTWNKIKYIYNMEKKD